MVSESSSKLKVLCLHGYGETGNLFSVKMRALREHMVNDIELYFPTGPIKLSNDKGQVDYSDEDSEDSLHVASTTCGWWRIDEYGDSKTLEPKISYEHLASYIRKHGPFDGIIGFSQGSNLAVNLAMFVTLPKYQEYFGQKDFRFGIFFSGYYRALSINGEIHEIKLKIPTLHFLGKYDNVLSTESSSTLIEVCEDSQVLFHPGAHHIPSPSAYVEVTADFIDFFGREDWPVVSKKISLIIPTPKPNPLSVSQYSNMNHPGSNNNHLEKELISKIVSRTSKNGLNIVLSNLQTFNEYEDILKRRVFSLVITDGQEPQSFDASVHYVPTFKQALSILKARESSFGHVFVIGDKRLLTLGLMCRCTKRIIAVTGAKDRYQMNTPVSSITHSAPFLEYSKEWLQAKSSQIRQWTGQNRLKHLSKDESGEPITMKLQMWERL
ncbi:serine hydrolase [Schizosaccharomyces octosporus yFS286]|uniref:Serine hydrolase n=1 Tax=Schizosaccharomyces octosporus (strain yFS286) TaxID=483514 RepID=S9Q073_SCHOY|nr:serine hydrolase [Schizosaccharomyces octosporus yFS286]EPX74721.1 serine hydrolase [Schizosaccharomyces octosporus yFS286]